MGGKPRSGTTLVLPTRDGPPPPPSPAGRARPPPLTRRREGGGNGIPLPRERGGNVHLVAFRCAHRGTQLSTGWVEGDNLRCFYHGWLYGPDGQCIEQPAEPEPFCQKI